MVKNFLITRPKYDLTTSYLHDFSKEIVKTIKETDDIHVTNLEGPKAIRLNVEKCLKKENPGLVFLNGHGDKNSVTGHDYETILDIKNIDLIKNKIVYTLSCDSLEGLGPTAIEKGANACVGYKARFMIVRDPSRAGTPSKDKNALPFKRACCKLINGLVFGYNKEEVLNT